MAVSPILSTSAASSSAIDRVSCLQNQLGFSLFSSNNTSIVRMNTTKNNIHPDDDTAADDKNKITKTNNNALTVIDHRTGKKYSLEIHNGTVQATQFLTMKDEHGAGIRLYDPGYMNTCVATSRICEIQGGKGILRYRGYPIEQLAERASFLECAYLLVYGSLPDKEQFSYFTSRVMKHSYVHEDIKAMTRSFRYDAHPMGMVIALVAALSTFHPEANPALAGQDIYKDYGLRNKQIHRLIGSITTIAAFAYRHRIGRELVDPVVPGSDLTYTENFLYMIDKLNQKNYRPHPRLAKALDILFILHADHELNCSTAAMRHLASSGVDVYSALAGAAGALYGPRHGGANEAVLRMLVKIGSVENVPKFVEGVKNRKEKLMGFGHRVYKNYDPRARIVRRVAEEVFSVVGREPLIEVAMALEKVALADQFFIDRKLYPNVDFYSGLIYKAMGFPTDFFPVLFLIPRTAGWLAHWYEFLDDPENRIVRPFQVYLGSGMRDFVPIEKRMPEVVDGNNNKLQLASPQSAESKRRSVGSGKI